MMRPDETLAVHRQLIPEDQTRPRLGVALGSGGARGWAHIGVFRALKELGVEVDVYAGCSAGALVSGAALMGFYDEMIDWAKSIGPIGAISSFGVHLSRGGLINPDKAFDIFRKHDKLIEDLPKPWGCVATDLSNGEEVWLTRGSAFEALRATSAVPMVIQAASYKALGEEHWLIDGAASNPVPVNLARALGAERVIAVDLNAVTQALTRFKRPTTRAVVPVLHPPDEHTGFAAPVGTFLKNCQRGVTRRLALAHARTMARPQFFETAIATVDILQAQLAEARANLDVADVRLTPDLSLGSAAAFDKWEDFERVGYETTMASREKILAAAAFAR
ncbi:patatin-like phospholipase family protein [Parvularcula sp. LCG005]|uniref:patatin-like phospholipase family protein n=1 Tax=Parvularcula sp. LCG005 TaxID=3078805 RepID=UPI0029421750|nr:patatin-like phospholipase family protein [Parvularcula sp. LCG005]WOI54192.1 patatin-like phospholipase family protein [Parvularcula sp. LCG005]